MQQVHVVPWQSSASTIIPMRRELKVIDPMNTVHVGSVLQRSSR